MTSKISIGITVGELIEKLSKYDSEIKVGIQVYSHDLTYLVSEHLDLRIIIECKEGLIGRIPKIESKLFLDNPENLETILVLETLKSL